MCILLSSCALNRRWFITNLEIYLCKLEYLGSYVHCIYHFPENTLFYCLFLRILTWGQLRETCTNCDLLSFSQVQRLPFLHSSNIALDTLRGNDECIGFEDILNGKYTFQGFCELPGVSILPGEKWDLGGQDLCMYSRQWKFINTFYFSFSPGF